MGSDRAVVARTHHSFIAYTLPTTGEVVPMRQRIAPSLACSACSLLPIWRTRWSRARDYVWATLLFAAASTLPVGLFVKRVWLFVSIFTGIMVLPATLSVMTPGDIVLTLWHWNGHSQGITGQGLGSAGRVMSRVAVIGMAYPLHLRAVGVGRTNI